MTTIHDFIRIPKFELTAFFENGTTMHATDLEFSTIGEFKDWLYKSGIAEERGLDVIVARPIIH